MDEVFECTSGESVCFPQPPPNQKLGNIVITNCFDQALTVGQYVEFFWNASANEIAMASVTWEFAGNDCSQDRTGCVYAPDSIVPGLEFDEASGIVAGIPTTPGVYCGSAQATSVLNPMETDAVDFSVSVSGDPHFVSFRGEKFDFHGEPNKYYNLFSDKNVQINALFKDWSGIPEREGFTAMTEIGIKWKNLRIKIDANEKAIYLNDVRVYDCLFGGGFIRTVSELPQKYQGTVDHLTGFGEYLVGYVVQLRGYEFFIPISNNLKWLSCPVFCNFLGNFKHMESDVHGIVGQTAMYTGEPRTSTGLNGEGIVEGHYSDYEVSSLWADDFKFNKWQDKPKRQPLLG